MSSAPSELKQDAFISYWQKNNLLLDEHSKGWVDQFHERLEYMLGEHLGRKAEIFRDPRLPKNAVLVEYLLNEIKETVALVAILTPGYVSSTWCMGELREFCERAKENGGLYVNGRSRVFVVVKLPPEKAVYPSEISGQTRYEFCTVNPKTGLLEEFSSDLRPYKDQRYWSTLSTLVQDLKALLSDTGRLAQPVHIDGNIFRQSSITPKKTIYLAETTSDLTEQRRQIKEELVLHGYKVLPHHPFPYEVGTYCEEVRKDIAESDVAINLLGRSYGLIPEGAGDRSILRLQLDVANERAGARSDFKRLVWMPEGWDTSDSKLGDLLKTVKLLADPHKGIEFWQTSLEEFKSLMHKRLTESRNGHAPKSPPLTKWKKIYLVCDRRDVSEAKSLIAYLQERKYEVVLPEFEEVEGEIPLSDLHQKNLLECDGVIVYYGNGNSRWVSAKKSDIEKHAGLEKTVDSARIRPLRAKAFYVTLPSTDLKEVFYTPVATIIKNFGPFDPGCLDDFIAQMEDETDDNEGGKEHVN